MYCGVWEELLMLAINHQPTHSKSFYYFGAALITAMVILLVIRLHPSFDLGLFKQSAPQNPGTVSKNNHGTNNPGTSGEQASVQTEPGTPGAINAINGIGNFNGSSGNSGSTPQSNAPSGSAPVSAGVGSSTIQPVITSGGSNGGSGSSQPPASGEPDGDEGPTVNLPPVNIAPSLTLPSLGL